MSNVNVLIINGRPRSGKDEMCKHIASLCISKYIVYEGLSSISIMKECLKRLGWDGNDKGDDERKLLSDMKQYTINHNPQLINDSIIESIMHTIFSNTRINERTPDCIFTIMIREPDQIDKFKERMKSFGGINVSTIYVDRKVTDIDNGIKSDNNVKNYRYDFIIKNNKDIKSLHEDTEKLINKIMEDKNGEKSKRYNINM